MLLDFGWSEILLIGVVALVVIGPKDLPKAMRVAGYWIRKARSMSHDFQMQVEQMIREAELDEVRDELKKASEIDLDSTIRDTVDPDGSLGESLKAPELPDFSDRPEGEGEAHAAPEDAVPADTPTPPASEAPSAEPAETAPAAAVSEEDTVPAASIGTEAEVASEERHEEPAAHASPLPMPEPAAPEAAPRKPVE